MKDRKVTITLDLPEDTSLNLLRTGLMDCALVAKCPATALMLAQGEYREGTPSITQCPPPSGDDYAKWREAGTQPEADADDQAPSLER